MPHYREFTYDDMVSLLSRHTNMRPAPSGGGVSFRCPAHADKNPSLVLSRSSAAPGSKKNWVIECKAGCDFYDVMDAIGVEHEKTKATKKKKQVEVTAKAAPAPPPTIQVADGIAIVASAIKEQPVVVANYDYRDTNDKPILRVVKSRLSDGSKTFHQEHADGYLPDNTPNWANGGNGIRCLYRLPELISAPIDQWVYWVEGEKDAETLRDMELLSTTTPGGAGSFDAKKIDISCLHGRKIALIPDADEAGAEYRKNVCMALAAKASVTVINLPAGYKDVTEWVENGKGTRAALERMVLAAAGDWACPNSPGNKWELGSVWINDMLYDGIPTIRWHNGHMYHWDKRKYIAMSNDEWEAMAIRWLARVDTAQATRANARELANSARARVHVPASVPIPTWIDATGRPTNDQYVSCTNGLIPLSSISEACQQDPLPHTPQWFSMSTLPYAFDRSADCPRWREFLEEVTLGNDGIIRLIQQWFGYHLWPGNALQAFMVLTGRGRNGKGVITRALRAMLGPDNVSDVPLSTMHERYNLFPTVGKLANITTETSEFDTDAETLIKAWTGEDSLQAERKYHDAFSFKASAKLTITTNDVPRFRDKSDGIWRRLILVPFEYQVPESQVDPGLDRKLAKELPGVLNWSIEGLRDLRDAGQFHIPTACSSAADEHRLDSDPAREFLLDTCRSCVGIDVSANGLYSAYVTWCKENGCRPLNARGFSRAVCRVFPMSERYRPWNGEGASRTYLYRHIHCAIPLDGLPPADPGIYDRDTGA